MNEARFALEVEAGDDSGSEWFACGDVSDGVFALISQFELGQTERSRFFLGNRIVDRTTDEVVASQRTTDSGRGEYVWDVEVAA